MGKARETYCKRREEVAIKACQQVGTLLMKSFGKKLRVHRKADRDLVTNIDKEAEAIITRLIKKNFPEDDILSEESHYLPSGSRSRWIIDPIDGTHNFIHQIENFGTSLALEVKGTVVLGVIYLPWTKELYTAQKGRGAFCNGKKIRVSKRSLEKATLVYDSTIRLHKRPMLKKLGVIADRVFNVRMFGSTVRSLTYLAEGKVDIEIEFNDKAWDFAAGLLLVEEAGGKATDFSGEHWSTDTKGYIASNRIAHQELVRIMRRK